MNPWPLAIVGAFALALAAISVRMRFGTRLGVPPLLVRGSLFAALLWSPYAWIITLEGTMDDYRRFWFGIWPTLPGLPAIVACKTMVRMEEPWIFVAGGVMALLLLGGAIALSGRGRWWFVAVIVLAIAYGSAMGPMSYALFAM
jgi:hypothetical protein